MPEDQNEQNVSRRGFLRAAAVTAVAATATGAGAALLKGNQKPLPVSSLATTTLPLTQTVITTNTDASADLFAQLTATRAENVRLQAKLDATERRLKSAESDDSEAEMLRVELGSATEQVSLLSGLIALYEQLDEVELGDLLDQGMASVTGSISELLDEVPGLAEGIEIGRQALDELEDHIPLLENGRRWLDGHMSKLLLLFGAVEQLLEAAVDAIGPFLEMLNKWFQDVLKWLPFGLGQRASKIMGAISDLITETPYTVSGLSSNIAQPMDVWLGRAEEEAPLRKNLVKPLREQVLQSAGQTIARAQNVQAVYQTQLVEPANNVANNQRAIRDLIAEYRQRHQV